MRKTSIAIFSGTLVAAAAACVVAASFAVRGIESTSVTQVGAALHKAKLDWAKVQADGLQVILTGDAPTEAMRFRAKTVAGTVVDASRVIDQMQNPAKKNLAPPRFSIEILRNEGDLSLIGLIPTSMDRDGLLQRIRRIKGVDTVDDLLQTADYTAPGDWDTSVDYAVRALTDLPNSKISMAADDIAITAMSTSPEDRKKLLSKLQAAAPDGLKLKLDISAPRPIIAPFTLRFVMDGDGPHFDACSADTAAARGRILAAARQVGMTGEQDCTIGLGVPSSAWGTAAALAIKAVGRLGGGSVSFSDADVSLVAKQGTAQSTFDDVVGELDSSLPDVYALHAVLPPAPDKTDHPAGPPEFTATLSPEGQLQLRGRVSDALMRKATLSLAQARFGEGAVHMAARLDDSLPEAWPTRVMAALDALSQLSSGMVTVTPGNITLKGLTGHKSASADIARLLGARLAKGADYNIDVTYHKELDPAAALPTPAECLAKLQAVQKDQKINFEPGSANVTMESRKLLDQMATILRTCKGLPLEIDGYTDSQGREEMNLTLSQSRAEAVMNELRMRRVLTRTFRARGFGEADPIADNGTEEGREANRRIEFRLRGQTEDPKTAGDAAKSDAKATTPPAPQDDATSSGDAAPAMGEDTDSDTGAGSGSDTGSGTGTDAGSDMGLTGSDAGEELGTDEDTD